MAADPLAVLPLDAAKRFLNEFDNTRHDDEIRDDFIPPAVERVERHLGRPLDPATMTASERLATKVALAEYWKTQRLRQQRGGRGATSASAVDGDSGPSGWAPLTRKLEELLGPAAGDAGEAPSGSFPAASPWPDPALPARLLR